MAFQKAEKKGLKLRVGITGPSGSGKTYTAIKLASEITRQTGGQIAVIDTERQSSLRVADEFSFDVDFIDEVTGYGPLTFVEKIQAAQRAGYAVIVLDSISHAWMGKGGALDQVDKLSVRQKGNKFTAWREVTPQHNALVDAMLSCDAHLIVTMRAKTEYVLEEKGGKRIPKKVGIGAIQRDGIEYEFDLFGEMDVEHNLFFTKTRCKALDGEVFPKPGREVAAILLEWAGNTPAPEAKPAESPPAEEPSLPKEPEKPTPEPEPQPVAPKVDGLTIQQLVDKLPVGLLKAGVPDEQIPDAIEAAIYAIRAHFNDAPAIEAIEDDKADELRSFMNGEMLTKLACFMEGKQ